MTEPASPQHGLQFTVNASILFTELPVLERPAAAKEAGFDAVEFWWPYPQDSVPSDADVDKFVQSITDAGVKLTGLNFAAGELPGPDRGLVSWVGREKEFADNVAIVEDIAKRLNVPALNALYGNRIEGVSAQEQDELALRNLTLAAEAAERAGAKVLLEPLSGSPDYPLTTADAVIDVIDKVGKDNVTLLNDIFHLANNGEDVDAAIEKYTKRTGHVQIADVPGRGEPGSGELDIDGYLVKLEKAGYSGYVGLEYKPSTGNTLESFAWLPKARRAAS